MKTSWLIENDTIRGMVFFLFLIPWRQVYKEAVKI